MTDVELDDLRDGRHGLHVVIRQAVTRVLKEYPKVSQFWKYGAAEFLKNPVYSRDFPPIQASKP